MGTDPRSRCLYLDSRRTPSPFVGPRASNMATRIGNYEIPDNALLGQGQFGKVKAAVHVETGARVACKILDKAKIKTKKDVETVKKEVKVMKELNGHPNILNMLICSRIAQASTLSSSLPRVV